MDPATIATIVMMAAKMAISLGQRIKGVDDAKEAKRNAKRQAAELSALMGARASVRADNTMELIGAQRLAVAQAGLASSSGEISARNKALLRLQVETRSDQIQTNQRIRALMNEAASGVKSAKQALIGGTVNDVIGTTSTLMETGRQQRDSNAARKEGTTGPNSSKRYTEIPTQDLTTGMASYG